MIVPISLGFVNEVKLWYATPKNKYPTKAGLKILHPNPPNNNFPIKGNYTLGKDSCDSTATIMYYVNTFVESTIVNEQCGYSSTSNKYINRRYVNFNSGNGFLSNCNSILFSLPNLINSLGVKSPSE